MDGQGDGWHNGPNSFRMPIPRGHRPPNDEPNMEFIAILDFIVNQDIVFVNEPEQWDLDNNNDNPNNVNLEHNNVVIEEIVDVVGDEAPLDDAVVAEVQMEGNPRLEELEHMSEQSRSQSREEEDEVRISECIRRLPILDLDDANPEPGPSRKRSEDGDDDRFFQQNSSDSSTDLDVFEAKLLLGRCKKNLTNALISQEEEREKTIMDFSEIPKSVSNSDKAEEGSDCEERLKDLITQEAEQDSPLSIKSDGKHFQWWTGCDDNISENSANLEGPEEESVSGGSICQRDSLHSEELRLNNVSIITEGDFPNSSKAETDRLSEGPDEDPLPGPSSRISRRDAGHQFDMTSSNRSQWWRQFGGNSSDSSTDLEDSRQILQPVPSRKRSVDDDREEAETRSNKRFRVTFRHDCNSDSGSDGEDWNSSRNLLDSHDSKGKKRFRWREEFSGKHKCDNVPSHGIKIGSHELTAGLSDQDADDALRHASSNNNSWQIQKRSLQSFQVGRRSDNSSDSADSGPEEPHKLSLWDNLSLLSLNGRRKIVNFQEGRTPKKSSSDPEAEEGSPPAQSTENLSEEEGSSGKK